MKSLPTDPRLGFPSEQATLREAAELQRCLADRVEDRNRIGRVRTVAGADVSYDRTDPRLYGAVVVLDAATLETVDTAAVVSTARFPYVPGYLSFREAPAVLDAFERLRIRPDLLVVDGHGRAHPRRFGLACHLGVQLDVPAIGVAKTVLIGSAGVPDPSRGSVASLTHARRVVGRVVRTRDGVSPVYVSVGHRISLRSAVEWVLRMGAGYRLPEPTRRAHLAVNEIRSRGGPRRPERGMHATVP